MNRPKMTTLRIAQGQNTPPGGVSPTRSAPSVSASAGQQRLEAVPRHTPRRHGRLRHLAPQHRQPGDVQDENADLCQQPSPDPPQPNSRSAGNPQERNGDQVQSDQQEGEVVEGIQSQHRSDRVDEQPTEPPGARRYLQQCP